MRRLAVGTAIALTAVVAAATTAPPRPSSAAPGENRAVVVVDTGDGEPRTACVVFQEASITGLQALEAARMEPEVYGYAGQGGAVCRLCGVGCPAGSGCLTCQSPKYWQYWRSDGGAAYTYSNAGAGSTRVGDGDIEGWVWGESRRSPLLVAVETVCADPSRTFRVASQSTTTTVASTTSSPPASPSSSAPDATAAGAPPALAPVAPPAPPASAPASSGAGSPSIAGTSAVDDVGAAADEGGSPEAAASSRGPQSVGTPGDERAGAAPEARAGDPNRSSAAGYAAFAVLLLALAGASMAARRHRGKSHVAKGVR